MTIRTVKLLPHQLKFIRDTKTRLLAMCCGYGAGKTRALIYKTIDLASLNPGSTGGLFSATHELATDILIPELDEQLEELGIPYSFKGSPNPRYILKFPHGHTTILIKSFENWKRIVGHNYAFACVDEIDTVDLAIAQKAWNKLLGRIRVGNVCQIAVTSTPEGFRFMHKTWVKEAVDKHGNPKKDRRIIHARSTDNPFLDPEYIPSLLENYPPELVEAYVNGQFVNLTSGVIYDTFDRELNACTTEAEPGDRLHIGMDFNVNKMAAVVHVTRDDLPHAVDELFDIVDTPAMIRAIQVRYPEQCRDRLVTIYPDATGGSRDPSDASKTSLSQLKQAGFYISAGKTNPPVIDRINTMRAAFLNAQGDRRYRVNVDKCPRYVECLERQVWGPDGRPDKSQEMDHGCFSGDTLVKTPKGLIPISEMPESGWVYSIGETPVPYHSCRVITENALTVRVTCSDGKIIICTPDHLFLTTNGWVQAQFLLGSELCKTTQPFFRKTSRSSEGYPIISLKTGTLSELTPVSTQTSSTCIERSGATTMGQFRRDITSIIKTEIDEIISYLTWNCCQPLSTLASTIRSDYRQTLKAISVTWLLELSRLEQRPEFGTSPTQGDNFTESWPYTSWSEIELACLKNHVRYALQYSSHPRQLLSTAGQNVGRSLLPGPEESLESMTRSEIARFAIANSRQTNTPGQSTATNHAQRVTVVSVEEDKPQDVYCLTVPRWGCFSLGNDLLVSNCDAGSYCIFRLLPIVPKLGYRSSFKSTS